MLETCITFGKIGARVMVEDKEVQHYSVQVDAVKKEVSCWIASEVGKTFSVVWLEHDVGFPTSGILYLDGSLTKGFSRQTGEKVPTVFRDFPISDSLVALYLFSPLVVTDDDSFLDSSSSCAVGEIKLVIYHTTTPVLSADQQRVFKALPQPQKLHERSKKAISHRVNYGSEIVVPRHKRYSSRPIERLVTFIFQYRPLEMLQANEVAPRNPEPLEFQGHARDPPPSPETSSGKRKKFIVKKEFDSEGEFEDEESKREKTLSAEVEGISKARQDKDDKHPKKKAKKENTTLFIPGEVIDLT